MGRFNGIRNTAVAKDTDRGYFMSAEEAKEYGIIDEIIFPK
ncbi:ATP-dependent Clp protease proteolytic subunit [Fictibacillus sp. WQ 8-8]|nr:ATP-dependent Clp protease proteolytic subunit [Fictibacillus sp. WQ 8-8]